MIFTAAGSDTTAATIEGVIIYMILYPEAKKKAQAELDAVIGKDRLPVLGDRPDLPYVTAFLMVQCLGAFRYLVGSFVLQEAMRCAPVAPLGG